MVTHFAIIKLLISNIADVDRDRRKKLYQKTRMQCGHLPVIQERCIHYEKVTEPKIVEIKQDVSG